MHVSIVADTRRRSQLELVFADSVSVFAVPVAVFAESVGVLAAQVTARYLTVWQGVFMTAELVHLSTEDDIATITLDSPHNRNALSTQLRRELLDALSSAAENSQARVIVLGHTGPVFCSGMDLKESRSDPRENTVETRGAGELPEILNRIWSAPKPVVAKIAGPARAGGLGIIAAADIAIGANEATFAFTEVRIGVAPAVISLPVLRRLHSRAAQELFLTGEVFDAQRAAEIGLLTRAVPGEKLDKETERFTRLLRKGSPGALAATKLLLNDPLPFSDEAFETMSLLSARMFASDEAAEGRSAFAEKRAPSWCDDPA